MSRGRIVHWMLEELAVPYETHWLEWGANGSKSPSYLKINPMGKVPAISHSNQIVTEAAAICMYLAESFPQSGLTPTPQERASYYRWILFAAGPFEHAVTNRSMQWEPPAERRGMVGYGSFDNVYQTLTQHLSTNDYVCGKRFNAADVYVGSAVIWALAFKSIPENATLTEYRDRLVVREAHRAAASINGRENRRS